MYPNSDFRVVAICTSEVKKDSKNFEKSIEPSPFYVCYPKIIQDISNSKRCTIYYYCAAQDNSQWSYKSLSQHD